MANGGRALVTDTASDETALLNEVINTAPVGMFWKARELTYLGCNRMYAECSGLSSQAEIVGKSDQDLAWREHASALREDDVAILERGVNLVRRVVQCRLRGREESWWCISKTPLRDAGGRIIGLAGFVEDVTEFKAAEYRNQSASRARRLLDKCTRYIVDAETEVRLLNNLCELILEAGYRMVWFGSIESDPAKSVLPIAQGGMHRDYLDSLRVTWSDTPLGRGPTGTAVREQKTIINRDFRTNPAAAPWRAAALAHGFQSSCAIPLIYRGECVAVLTIYASEADAFHDEEIVLLEELARNISVGLGAIRERSRRIAQLASANEALAELSRHDELTGLPNRLAANERLHLEFVTMKRTSRPYAVLMMDLDHFKEVNDNHGHEAGDRILRRIGFSIQNALRRRDFSCRFGGEEFLVLLPETDMKGALKVAEHLRKTVADLVDPQVGKVTISIGIAVASPLQTSEDDAVRAADECLYEAKHLGRNRVVS